MNVSSESMYFKTIRYTIDFRFMQDVIFQIHLQKRVANFSRFQTYYIISCFNRKNVIHTLCSVLPQKLCIAFYIWILALFSTTVSCFLFSLTLCSVSSRTVLRTTHLGWLQRELLSSCSIYRQVADKFKSGFTNKWKKQAFYPFEIKYQETNG